MDKGRPRNASTGLALAIELLVERLSQNGALDRTKYVSDLKKVYNALGDEQASSEGGKLLHSMIRHLEHRAKKSPQG